jgi:hypothetical protein
MERRDGQSVHRVFAPDPDAVANPSVTDAPVAEPSADVDVTSRTSGL